MKSFITCFLWSVLPESCLRNLWHILLSLRYFINFNFRFMIHLSFSFVYSMRWGFSSICLFQNVCPVYPGAFREKTVLDHCVATWLYRRTRRSVVPFASTVTVSFLHCCNFYTFTLSLDFYQRDSADFLSHQEEFGHLPSTCGFLKINLSVAILKNFCRISFWRHLIYRSAWIDKCHSISNHSTVTIIDPPISVFFHFFQWCFVVWAKVLHLFR